MKADWEGGGFLLALRPLTGVDAAMRNARTKRFLSRRAAMLCAMRVTIVFCTGSGPKAILAFCRDVGWHFLARGLLELGLPDANFAVTDTIVSPLNSTQLWEE